MNMDVADYFNIYVYSIYTHIYMYIFDVIFQILVMIIIIVVDYDVVDNNTNTIFLKISS